MVGGCGVGADRANSCIMGQGWNAACLGEGRTKKDQGLCLLVHGLIHWFLEINDRDEEFVKPTDI